MPTRRDHHGQHPTLQDLTIQELMHFLTGWHPGVTAKASRFWRTWPEYFAAYEGLRAEVLRRHGRTPWRSFAEHALTAWRLGNTDPYAAGRSGYEEGKATYGRDAQHAARVLAERSARG